MPDTPDGDWLGTPYLSFKREGPFAICTLDRPQARNAMTPAMYFGIRYAITRVSADPDLAGLLITGTGDVFAPGGDLGQGGVDNWMDFASTMGMDVTPFDVLRQSSKPVVAAVNGLCQGGGLQIALCSDMLSSATVRRSECRSCSAASPTPITVRCSCGSSGPCAPGT